MRVAAVSTVVVTATLAAGVLAAPETPAAQDQQQRPGQFRTTGRVVPVYTTVTDRSGLPIEGLTAEDFQVFDDGEPQAITQFSADDVPLSAMVLLDGSSSMMQSLDRVIEGANSFVVRMLPDDRARIGSFAERIRLSPRFTSDRDELLRYLSNEFNVVVGLATHLWNAMSEGMDALAEEPGKRVLLVLSDGHNWVAPGQTLMGGGRDRRGRQVPSLSFSGGPSTTEDDVVRAAARRDVIVYGISMWVWFNGREQPPSRDLQRLALDTGGSYFELRDVDEINSTFTQIARELRQGYALGFAPQQLDGRTHEVEVRVNRSEATVRARRHYVAEGR
jgi:Ca-activated chloride channel family protein